MFYLSELCSKWSVATKSQIMCGKWGRALRSGLEMCRSASSATTSICILRDIIVHCKCQRKFIYTERLWLLTRSKLGEWSQEQITWKGLFLLKHSLAITFFQTLHLKNLPEIQDGRHKWPPDITTSLKIDLSDYYKPPLTMENTIAKECLFPWIFGFPGVTQCL